MPNHLHLVTDEAAIQPSDQWRLMIFDRPIGEWRDSYDEAAQDAVRTGNGAWDEETGIFYVTVPAWFASRDRR